MRVRRVLLWCVMTLGSMAQAQDVMTLEQCRSTALNNNLTLRQAREAVRGAGYKVDEAKAAYLPALDFAGGYLYNQRKISIFDSDQLLPTKTFDPKTGKYEFNLLTGPDGVPVLGPNKQPIPETVALIPKEAMTYDIHNVFFGAVTLTQPIYMGGKIRALNQLARSGHELAQAQERGKEEDVLVGVDAAYWQVVSVRAKRDLATSYLSLLDTLQRNVGEMLGQGVATKADLLTVNVKLNQAQVDKVKVDNGLVLSRMALAQVCGLPVDTQLQPADSVNTTVTDTVVPLYDMEQVYARRPDMEQLRLGIQALGHQAEVEKSAMLPQLALVGAYSFTNPNMFDGFEKKFRGAFSVGAMLKIPLWHWGGNYNKYRAARSEQTCMKLKMQDAITLVNLQVSQCRYRLEESVKTLKMTRANIASAEENLKVATYAFAEGMATVDHVMEAQTAWLKAKSEEIDAAIDLRMCHTYLEKALGTLVSEK